MAVKQSNAALGLIALAYPSCAGQVSAQRFTYAVPAGGVPLNDIIEMAPIPPGCVVVDMTLDTDDLDTNGAPAIALDVGIMSGDWGVADNARTCGAEFFAGATTAQAGGLARPTLKSAQRVSPSDKARSIGIKIATAAATAAAGEIGLTVHLAAAG